jgi:hypothetical protein
MSDSIKRCAACRKEKRVSEMKVCMHNQMHRYVCDSTCMNDFYNPPKKSAAPEPVQGDSVFVVGYHCRDANGLATLNWLPHDNAVPLMTVDQHNRIMAALQQPDVHVQVTGSLDEIDAPVWPFINAEALKVGAEKGRIETYRYEQANGCVAVLWDANNVHAMAVTIRDGMNRTRCVRIMAAAKPDAELVERVAKAIYEQWSGNPHYRPWVDGGNSFKQDDCRALARKACSIDAKLASLRKGEA